jgi:hypothetical protein
MFNSLRSSIGDAAPVPDDWVAIEDVTAVDGVAVSEALLL